MDESTEKELPNGWQRVFSKTHQQYYWFNSNDGSSSWVDPIGGGASATSADANSASEGSGEGSKKRAAVQEEYAEGAAKKVGMERATPAPYIAIIVPFRDAHIEQKRKEHLNKFVPAMTEFLSRSGKPFKIFVIEQSLDGRKFNRGKLLNIGFDIAKSEGAQLFIFHDVDLLPSIELLQYYSQPATQPVHIARVWNRYSGNSKYFGGIVSFTASNFQVINGFPNNFWGWGGEDDEMYKRVKRVGLKPGEPTAGSIIDMEDMTLQSKLAFLKENKLWKCMNKTEVLDEHNATWQSNGLNSLKYVVLTRELLDGTLSEKYCVDVLENEHWTDLVCSDSSTQLEEPVENLKRTFSEQQYKKKSQTMTLE